MEDLVEYTSPFHNWKHLRDDMRSIADEWGGSGSGGGGGGASAAAVPAATEKVPPTSGGTMTSSFFGKRRPSKDATMAAALALHYKGTASSSGLGSKVSSSTTHAKEKELKMGQQEKDAAAAKASKPKGCIPFLGMSRIFIWNCFLVYVVGCFCVFFLSPIHFLTFVCNLVYRTLSF